MFYPNATCNAWPEESRASLESLLQECGWAIVDEQAPASWEEFFHLADASARQHDQEDGLTWCLGYWRASGWQLLYDASPWPGGLRELYTNLPYPLLEWVIYGNDHDFDLDIMIEQHFFPASVRSGRLDQSGKGLQARAIDARLPEAVSSEDMLLQIALPQAPGFASELSVYPSLSRTLQRLGVPGTLWPPPSAAKPVFLHLQDLASSGPVEIVNQGKQDR